MTPPEWLPGQDPDHRWCRWHGHTVDAVYDRDTCVWSAALHTRAHAPLCQAHSLGTLARRLTEWDQAELDRRAVVRT